MLGIDPSTLSQWENKKKELPPIRSINKIVEILEDAGRLPNLVEEPKSNVVWVKCPECTQTVPGVIGAKRFHHCAACGESLGKICDNPNCHHLNRFTAKYCEACGYHLKTHNTDYRIVTGKPFGDRKSTRLNSSH